MLLVFWARTTHTQTNHIAAPLTGAYKTKQRCTDAQGEERGCRNHRKNRLNSQDKEIRSGMNLEEDLNTTWALHMGNRLPGYSEEKLPSKFKPGVEERERGERGAERR